MTIYACDECDHLALHHGFDYDLCNNHYQEFVDDCAHEFEEGICLNCGTYDDREPLDDDVPDYGDILRANGEATRY